VVQRFLLTRKERGKIGAKKRPSLKANERWRALEQGMGVAGGARIFHLIIKRRNLSKKDGGLKKGKKHEMGTQGEGRVRGWTYLSDTGEGVRKGGLSFYIKKTLRREYGNTHLR